MTFLKTTHDLKSWGYAETQWVFGQHSYLVLGFAREKLHAIHQHSFLLSKSIWFQVQSVAYLVFNLFFTDTVHMYFTGVPLNYNCSNTEKRKNKCIHYSSIIFLSQWDLYFHKLSAWKDWNMYPMDDLKLRMEVLDGIVEISKLFTHLCEFCMPWLRSLLLVPRTKALGGR